MSLAKGRRSSSLDNGAALHAICSTGKGRCWYCDHHLPPEEKALRSGWQVQRVEGDRVASIILVCPKCQRARAKLGEEEFLRVLSLRPCNAAY